MWTYVLSWGQIANYIKVSQPHSNMKALEMEIAFSSNFIYQEIEKNENKHGLGSD